MRCARFVAGCLAAAALGLGAGSAAAQSAAPQSAAAPDTIKIGFVVPVTGTAAAVGREISDAAKLYMAQHGDMVAGKKIELLIRDDAGVPDNAKRIAQDLIENDKVSVLVAGLTPSALAMAPVVTEAKIPTVLVAPGASAVTDSSLYYVRTSFTLGQEAGTIADWAIKTGSKTAVSVLSEADPGDEAGKAFAANFTKGGGQILDTLQVPLANPDFSPVLQRAHDLQPDTLFVSLPAAQATTFARQFSERGLDKSGIRLLGPGYLIDDYDLAATGDAFLATITAGTYSAAHPSQLNKDFVAAYKKAAGHRPNVIAVSAYDGLALICQALQQTGGNTDADAVIGAMKGMTWKSPRGPVAIDPRTRDIVQNVYIRKIVRVDGEPWAIEFATFPAVKDPLKEAAAR